MNAVKLSTTSDVRSCPSARTSNTPQCATIRGKPRLLDATSVSTDRIWMSEFELSVGLIGGMWWPFARKLSGTSAKQGYSFRYVAISGMPTMFVIGSGCQGSTVSKPQFSQIAWKEDLESPEYKLKNLCQS